MKKTKKAYEEHLNSLPTNSDMFIIGGKIRMYHYHLKQYGTALRKFDPIAFRVGYNEWKSIK